jgi:hypothetical protein
VVRERPPWVSTQTCPDEASIFLGGGCSHALGQGGEVWLHPVCGPSCCVAQDTTDCLLLSFCCAALQRRRRRRAAQLHSSVVTAAGGGGGARGDSCVALGPAGLAGLDVNFNLFIRSHSQQRPGVVLATHWVRGKKVCPLEPAWHEACSCASSCRALRARAWKKPNTGLVTLCMCRRGVGVGGGVRA